MKQSSALPITSPKNISISRKQHLGNHHPSVAIFVSVEEPEDSHEGWKARFLICVQFWSNLNSYYGFVSFLISHKQLLRKISGRNTATWSSRNYIPESSYSFETGLLLCRKISKALPLGKMRTWENFVQPFSCLFPSPFVYPHLSISLPSCPTAEDSVATIVAVSEPYWWATSSCSLALVFLSARFLLQLP